MTKLCWSYDGKIMLCNVARDGEIPGASQKEMRDIYQLYYEQGGIIN
ncbi:MAG TPA: hypothetical protein VHO03_08390 [Ignavibacteriales bacterium]|nr:hypothetical protein [Ignavibacteriales bacterium]